MAEKEIFSLKADVLRQRAEVKAVRMTENLEAMSLEEIQRILYELRVHQIELEMQNEELVAIHERYYTLYVALASEEPMPCMEILEELSQRRWSEDPETALAEVNRLVQQYSLAEALAFLNKEFDDVVKKTEERDDDRDNN